MIHTARCTHTLLYAPGEQAYMRLSFVTVCTVPIQA